MFYNYYLCLSFQLKDLLVRTIDAFVDLFDETDKSYLPILKMELTFDDEKMQFYPLKEDLEETVLYVVQHICKAMQQLPNIQQWLSGASAINMMEITVADHILKKSVDKLKEAVKRYFKAPEDHLDSFGKCLHQLVW